MSSPDPSVDSTAQSSGGVFASMQVGQFRWLFASNTTFFLAMGGMQVLRSWLVFQLTGSELSLGLISAMVAVPMLVIAPFGGAIADRMDRRKLVALGQTIVIVGESTVLALLMLDRLEFWHLLVMAFLMGSAFPFIMPARQAIVANVVGRARLTNAMALNMAAVNTTRIVGPAAAGFLIGWIGLERAYAVNVSLYLLALIALWGLQPAMPPGNMTATMGENLREGFTYLFQDRLVLVLLFFGLVPMFLVMPFQNLLVVFTEDVWNVGPEGLGIMSAATGVGGLIGAVMVASRGSSRERLRSMMMAVVAFGVLLLLFALSPWYLLALPLVLGANIFASYYSALNNTAVQVLIPDEVRGRVSSFLMMSFSLPLLGTLPVGAAAEVWGAPAAVGAASVLAVLAAFAFYAGSPSLRLMDQRLKQAVVD
jgi:MFS family permease